jgi:hypothetical protein
VVYIPFGMLSPTEINYRSNMNLHDKSSSPFKGPAGDHCPPCLVKSEGIPFRLARIYTRLKRGSIILFASSTQAVAGRLRGMVASVSERAAMPFFGFLDTRMFLGTIDVTIAGHDVGRFVAAERMHVNLQGKEFSIQICYQGCG